MLHFQQLRGSAEMNVYLWNVHGRCQANPRIYHPSQITRAEQEIGLSRKRIATTAQQAFTPRNLMWHRRHWTQPCPFGIADIRACDMVDMDEAVVNIVIHYCLVDLAMMPLFRAWLL